MGKQTVDYLIIGAGPAGLQMGYFLERAGRDYLILERGESPGTFFRTFPRHRKLISINKRFTGYDDAEVNLRWDWNSLLSDDPQMVFGEYSERYFPDAQDLVKYLGDFANRFDLNVRYETRITRIAKEGGFIVTDSEDNSYYCQYLIMATGVSVPYVPDIPGIELSQNYTAVSTDLREFENQSVLIIGKGNSAFETADHLIESAATIHLVSPRSISMAWQTHFVGNLRAVNNNLLDTYQLKSQNAVLDAKIRWIKPEGQRYRVSFDYQHANGENEELVYDHIIACTGFRFDDSIFAPDMRPALMINNRFPELSPEWESTNIDDLYFCGTLMQSRDHKKTSSGFIHGFRYNAQSLFRILSSKYHGEEWPFNTLPGDPDTLMEAVLKRINKTSALWQQFGFLCDVFVLDLAKNSVSHYEELPVDYVRQWEMDASKHYYLVTLEYGEDHAMQDPFKHERIDRHDVSRANQSQFLHPVIRRYDSGGVISEHHVIEDLAAEWLEQEHRQPLLEFFRRNLADVAA